MKIKKQCSFFKFSLYSLLSFVILFNSLVISTSVETEELSQETVDKYLKQKEWLGLCETGLRQSPINIVYQGNTTPDNSKIEIKYEFPKEKAHTKFHYDGVSLYLDINLGDIKFHKTNGEVETYTSNKIELHFPAEHYITMAGQTSRAPVELQIHHIKTKTEGNNYDDKKQHDAIRTNRAVISILFNVGATQEGDMFLNQMGISKFNTKPNGKYNVPNPNEDVNRIGQTPASYETGFNFVAFSGLIYNLNADKHLLFYYGSETSPPCREDVLWIIYAEYRSISTAQFDFLNKMITKPRNKEDKNKITSYRQLYGNKRDIKRYNEFSRGKILSNQFGLMSSTGLSYFSEDPADTNE